MKTIFTLLSSLIMSVAVFAAPSVTPAKLKSTLTVKSSDYGDIRVVVDGRRFEPNDNSIVISGLEYGMHTIKILRQRNTGLFSILGRKYEQVYNKSMLIRSGTNVLMSIDRSGRTSIVERKIDTRGDRDDRDWNRDRDDHGYDYDRDGKFGDYDQNYGYEKGMDDREFRMLMQSIDKEWLETNKLKSATQVVRTNSLTSAQVKQLVLMFSFEMNKLELAKQAYQNTVDKKNYYMINDAFSFNGSKDELNRYIRNFH